VRPVEGKYVVRLRPGTYRVTLNAGALYEPYTATLVVNENTTHQVELKRDSRFNSHTVKGRVYALNLDGQPTPVAGAFVYLGDATFFDLLVNTDSAGRFSIYAPRGRFSYIVAAPGHHGVIDTIEIVNDTVVDFGLHRR
jgi:hypothetical protein